MKWISLIAGIAFFLGFAMVREGQIANSMKSENREALILYGILVCSMSCVWFAIHGLTAMLRKGSKKKPPDSAVSSGPAKSVND